MVKVPFEQYADKKLTNIGCLFNRSDVKTYYYRTLSNSSEYDSALTWLTWLTGFFHVDF